MPFPQRQKLNKQQRVAALLQASDELSGYARRWAVSRAADVSAAHIFDAACAVLANHGGAVKLGEQALAAAERRTRLGVERPAGEFTLPVSLDEATRSLQRFARRYADGRGFSAAVTVNAVTRRLLDAGLTLADPHAEGEPIWARSRPTALTRRPSPDSAGGER